MTIICTFSWGNRHISRIIRARSARTQMRICNKGPNLANAQVRFTISVSPEFRISHFLHKSSQFNEFHQNMPPKYQKMTNFEFMGLFISKKRCTPMKASRKSFIFRSWIGHNVRTKWGQRDWNEYKFPKIAISMRNFIEKVSARCKEYFHAIPIS